MTKYKQHCGRTQAGAAYRVALGRNIKRSGHNIKASEHTTKQLETMHRRYVGKLPKRYP